MLAKISPRFHRRSQQCEIQFGSFSKLFCFGGQHTESTVRRASAQVYGWKTTAFPSFYLDFQLRKM